MLGVLILSLVFTIPYMPTAHANTVASQANPPYNTLTTTDIVDGSSCSLYSDGAGSCGYVQQSTSQVSGNLYTASYGGDGEYQAYYQTDASPCPQNGVYSFNCPSPANDATVDGSICCNMFADVALYGQMGGSGSSTSGAGFGTSLIAVEFEIFESATWYDCGYFNGVYQCIPHTYWKWVKTYTPFVCVQQADTSFLGNIGNPPICSGTPASSYTLNTGGRIVYSVAPPDGTGHGYLMEVDVLSEAFTGTGTPYCNPPYCTSSGAFGISNFFNNGYYANLYRYGFIQSSNPNPPTPVSPANNFIGNSNTGTFTWNPAPDPWPNLGYTLQLSTDPNFGASVQTFSISSANYPNNNFYTTTQSDGKYYWRVSETAGNGLTSAWSQVFTLTIDTSPPSTPVLLSPANGASTASQTNTLSWAAATDANGVASYNLQVDTSSSFNSPSLISKTGLISTSYQVTLQPSTNYWRVQAVDNAGNVGAWSAPFNLNVGDFSISVAPNPLNVNSGSSGSWTVSATSLYTFTGTVTFSDIAPSGLTCTSFNPPSVTLTSSVTSAASTLSCSGPTNSYSVKVTGTSGSISHS